MSFLKLINVEFNDDYLFRVMNLTSYRSVNKNQLQNAIFGSKLLSHITP